MSCVESKLVLRLELPFLKGKSNTEAYEYFKDILGEAEELDEWKGEVEYFNYQGKVQPITDYQGSWGADYVLYDSSENMDYNGSILEVNERAKEIASMFNMSEKDVKLFAYNWYNGGDEPVKF